MKRREFMKLAAAATISPAIISTAKPTLPNNPYLEPLYRVQLLKQGYGSEPNTIEHVYYDVASKRSTIIKDGKVVCTHVFEHCPYIWSKSMNKKVEAGVIKFVIRSIT